jgi:Ubiquitin-conjugating enzyme
MGSSQKRITKADLSHAVFIPCVYVLTGLQELAEVLGNPPEGITVNLIDEGNVHNWNIVMDGPEGSPYQVRIPI